MVTKHRKNYDYSVQRCMFYTAVKYVNQYTKKQQQKELIEKPIAIERVLIIVKKQIYISKHQPSIWCCRDI